MMTDIYRLNKTEYDHSIDGLLELIGGLPLVDSASYSSENGIDTSPAALTITPVEGTQAELMEQLAVVTKVAVEQLYDVQIKASIEHPPKPVTNEDGDVITLVANENEHIISIRWNVQMATTPSDVRFEGYAVDESVLDIDQEQDPSNDQADTNQSEELPTFLN